MIRVEKIRRTVMHKNNNNNSIHYVLYTNVNLKDAAQGFISVL